MKGPERKLFVKTFGCQMNVYESERMAEALAPSGYAATDAIEQADLVILNTCHIREKAAEKVYSELGRVGGIKTLRRRQGKRTIVAVAGCVAQAEGREIVERAPLVDFVIGPQSYHRLPDLVSRAHREDCKIVDTEFPDEDKFRRLPARAKRRRPPAAFLTIQEGCDRFCTFCVVPYTRGVEYSRPAAAVLSEAEQLAEAGVREITLLGQNVNAYHGEGPDGCDWSLARLLRGVAAIDGIERIRYTTGHPRDMDEELIAVHREVGKVMPYLHLPFQAGADRILAAMNRKHTAEDYLRLVERIRTSRPDIALSTDIIVGFPGETDEEFEETLRVVDRVSFAQAYSFKYSARPGTPASTMEDQVPDAVKAERLATLQRLLESQRSAFNRACLGTVMPILLERKGRKAGQLVGRSPYLQAVHTMAPESMIGELIDVAIVAAGPNSLEGDMNSTSGSRLEAVALQ